MNALDKRVIDLCYKHTLNHVGSSLTALPLIDQIYSVKKKDEPFILSNGHAAPALFAVLEKYEGKDADELVKKHGGHPSRDLGDGIWVTTGSLGQGITIAVGMALADPTKNVYCMISDGECAEGSVWEALRIAGDLRLENLRIVCNANGYGAYGRTDTEMLRERLNLFYPVAFAETNMYDYPPYLQGLEAHYHVLTTLEYKELEAFYAANLC